MVRVGLIISLNSPEYHISFKKNVLNESLLDFEWGYQLQRDYSGDSLYKTIEKPYRLWTRYSNEKLEARLV